MSEKTVLEIKDLRLELHSQGNTFSLLLDELELVENDSVAVIGRSGSGKTTFLNVLAGFAPSYSGSLRWNAAASHSVQMVFQGDRALFPNMTVLQNIKFGLENDKLTNVEEVLSSVGLLEWRDSWPKSLSGGMKKRLELARALIRQPDLLLLDEAFSSLDIVTRAEMIELLAQVKAHRDMTVVSVSHSISEAVNLCNRALIVSDGVITELELPSALNDRRRLMSEALSVGILNE